MTREALKKLNEKQMNYCKTLSALIDAVLRRGQYESIHYVGALGGAEDNCRYYGGGKCWLGTLEEWRRLD